jgi:insertion element IS1 protein InsB
MVQTNAAISNTIAKIAAFIVFLNLKIVKEHPDITKALRTYRERASLRGIERIFNVCRKTVMRWLLEEAEELPDLAETLLPAQPDDVLELDEAWSFVGKKQAKRWLWTAICRRTRQIVAFVIGDHSEYTC